MKSDIITIKGLGILDWRRIDERGLARFAKMSIMEYKPKSKTDNQLVLRRTRLKKDQMTICLGLTLTIPKAMPNLRQEDGWFDEKNHLHIMRQIRGIGFPKFYSDTVITKMTGSFRKFLKKLKEVLEATKVSYVISNKDPKYVEISVVIDHYDFNFPTTFINRLVENLNSQLK